MTLILYFHLKKENESAIIPHPLSVLRSFLSFLPAALERSLRALWRELPPESKAAGQRKENKEVWAHIMLERQTISQRSVCLSE